MRVLHRILDPQLRSLEAKALTEEMALNPVKELQFLKPDHRGARHVPVGKQSREALEAMVSRTGWVLDSATSGCFNVV
ncbi:hypothetical protein A5733_17600 [Mycobacterium sp. NS-7484]|nr:hypothetical protein A5699_20095 [Mycobacterium sp. E802]OMB92536.1 hypothetical protein A5733_17600 [Mycobacterium sp. NS-7484]